MKKIAFVAHDPGSFDSLYPVFKEMEKDAVFLALGPSAAKLPENAVDKGGLEKTLAPLADDGNLSGVLMGRDWGTDIDVRLLSWTRQRGVKSVVLLDYWSNYSNAFRDGEMQYWPDAYLVMDEIAWQEAKADGVPEEILRIVGQPGLDKYCRMGKNLSAPDRDVLFLSQPLSVLYGDSLGYTEQSVLSDIQRACRECGRKLDVKFHPKDEPGFQEQYRDIAVNGDVDELMKHYRLVIGMTTMALLHAAMMHVLVASYQPGLKVQDGCITNRLGLSKDLRAYKELVNVLVDKSSTRFDNLAKSATTPIWMDGNSTLRAIEAIKDIFEL